MEASDKEKLILQLRAMSSEGLKALRKALDPDEKFDKEAISLISSELVKRRNAGRREKK